EAVLLRFFVADQPRPQCSSVKRIGMTTSEATTVPPDRAGLKTLALPGLPGPGLPGRCRGQLLTLDIQSNAGHGIPDLSGVKSRPRIAILAHRKHGATSEMANFKIHLLLAKSLLDWRSYRWSNIS